jgi:hypothetical protein
MTDHNLEAMLYRQYDRLPFKSAGAMWNAATPACEYCHVRPYLGTVSLHDITFMILHTEDCPRYRPGSPVAREGEPQP